jgi:DNA-binding CsgD family transcriptional regulator
MSGDAKQRAGDRIARLARRHLDLVSFWQESAEAIASAVPYDQAPCWYTLDPASLLITSHFNEDMPEIPGEWLAQEYYEDDVNNLADVARSQRGISTLHEATGGDPTRSPRWQANIALGGDQELIAALRTPSGEVWGALGLYREPGQPLFDAQELAFLRAVAPYLAEGARRALLAGEATDPEGPEAPGLIVLSGNWEVESTTPGVQRWLAELPDGDWEAGRLPSAVLAVAGRALRTAEHPDQPGEVAVSRVLSRSGTWVVLHGAALVSGGAGRVAVIVEPAHPARIAPLLMSAYGLTEREREVTRLVLQGSSTAEIAARLVVSAHTVQQHLKRVFDKTGVRSRRDLVGKVFFAYYEPRVRDNERRAIQQRLLRGGPLDGSAIT